MSTWMMRRVAHDMTIERHVEADRIRRARASEIAPNQRRERAMARHAGPISVVVALAMLLVSIPVLSGAPTASVSAPMPSPTPAAASSR